MSKIKAPLFSLYATGTLDKNITYKGKLRDQIAQKYSKPGDKNPFESSPRQKDQRSIIRLITIHWQCMSSVDKLSWENAAKDVRFKGTGYHYFLHMAQQNLTQYLGLVGYWTMNYNINDKILDLSGNGNHGTLLPTYPTDCPILIDSFDKKHGKALSSNGTSNYVNCGTGDSLDITGSLLTMECWFRAQAQEDNDYFFSKWDKGPPALGYGIGLYSTSLKYFIITSDGTFTYVPSFIASFTEWYHFAVTYDGSFLTCYLNGDVLTSDPATGNILTTVGPLMLARLNYPGLYFKGFIDDVLIWTRSLSQLEIKKHYLI